MRDGLGVGSVVGCVELGRSVCEGESGRFRGVLLCRFYGGREFGIGRGRYSGFGLRWDKYVDIE